MNEKFLVLVEGFRNSGTSHNRPVYASPPVGGSGFRSARSLRSHASLHPHFVGPGFCNQNDFRAAQNAEKPRTLLAKFPKNCYEGSAMDGGRASYILLFLFFF
jgi:hypothetical protein